MEGAENETAENSSDINYNFKRKDSFIRLDRNFIRVLGLNNATVFCHLLDIEKTINTKRNKEEAIYQQLDIIIYETGLSKPTINKAIKELSDNWKLLHVIPHTEGNKNKYKIDYDNLEELKKIIRLNTDKKDKRNSKTLKKFKERCKNLYYEWLKNNTTSDIKFYTTNKELIEKELKEKELVAVKTFSDENVNSFTINFYNEKVFDESITFYYIPRIFKKTESKEKITDFYINTKNINKKELIILEYFLQCYYMRYGEYHKKIDISKLTELTQRLNEILDLPFINNDMNFMEDVIDEFFKTKNTSKKRDLTLYLFTSHDDTKHTFEKYSWINILSTRLST